MVNYIQVPTVTRPHLIIRLQLSIFAGRQPRFSYKSDQLHFLYMDEAHF